MLRAPGPERRAGGVCAQTPLLPGTLCPLNRAGTGGTRATTTGTAAARTPAGTLSAAETRTETAAGGGRGGAGGAGGGDRSRTGLQPRLASNSLPTGWGDVGGRGGRSRGPRAGNSPRRVVACSPTHLSGSPDMPQPPQTQKREGEIAQPGNGCTKPAAACGAVSISRLRLLTSANRKPANPLSRPPGGPPRTPIPPRLEPNLHPHRKHLDV